VLKSDVAVAKNYLGEGEIKALERVVSMYLDEVLDAGRVSTAVAQELARGEFARYRVIQDRDYEGDFEREAKRLAERAGSDPTERL
jgi:hypothetical protein